MKRKTYIKPTLRTIQIEASGIICISGGTTPQGWHTQLGGGGSEETIFGGDTDGSGSGSSPDIDGSGTIWIE